MSFRIWMAVAAMLLAPGCRKTADEGGLQGTPAAAAPDPAALAPGTFGGIHVPAPAAPDTEPPSGAEPDAEADAPSGPAEPSAPSRSGSGSRGGARGDREPASSNPPEPEPSDPADEPPAAPPDPSLPATPSRSVVNEAFRGATDDVRSCLGGVAAVGSVRATFEGPTGAVASVAVTDDLGRAEGCIEGAIRKIRLPPFSQATYVVNFPYRISGASNSLQDAMRQAAGP